MLVILGMLILEDRRDNLIQDWGRTKLISSLPSPVERALSTWFGFRPEHESQNKSLGNNANNLSLLSHQKNIKISISNDSRRMPPLYYHRRRRQLTEMGRTPPLDAASVYLSKRSLLKKWTVCASGSFLIIVSLLTSKLAFFARK